MFRQPLRSVARRLPVLGAYERRIAELTTEVYRLGGGSRTGPVRMFDFRPSGHYYSPDPDLEQLSPRRDQLFAADPCDLPGVDVRWEAQQALFEELAERVVDVPFGEHEAPGQRYWFDNHSYAYGDGLFLHLMLRWLQPRRIIEVGSGHSSACMLDTMAGFLDPGVGVTFIDPYDELLRSLLRPGDEERVEILPLPVQDVPLERFAELEAGDLLFIDSTHVVKLGSDVNHLLFEVLPRIRPGVVVHLHDVFPGFEYPWEWHEEGRVWTETYLLRAFLMFNPAFEVLLWPPLAARVRPDWFFERFPMAQHNSGGSLYLRRRPD